LLALFVNLAVSKVTVLEPRTPHQPEKLKKLSKNDCLFTLSIFSVNGKVRAVTACVFNRVQAVHRPVTEFGANRSSISRKSRARRGISHGVLTGINVRLQPRSFQPLVKIAQFSRPARVSR